MDVRGIATAKAKIEASLVDFSLALNGLLSILME